MTSNVNHSTLKRISTHLIQYFLHTPCPVSLVRCAPVASSVDSFAEIPSPVPNYASPGNKWKSLLSRSCRDSIPSNS